MNKKHWWKVMLLILVVSGAGVMFIGRQTYQHAPPIPDFVDESGKVVVAKETILAGQRLFQEKALMEYGTYFGDGSLRGPDFTADALHYMAVYMNEYYSGKLAGDRPEEPEKVRNAAALARVQLEIKENRYDEKTHTVVLTEGQVHAYAKLREHYRMMFGGEGPEAMKPADYIKGEEQISGVTAFFFWGGWVCGAQRPGDDASYTHNWPYDPLAGNLPTGSIMLWSVIGALGLCLVLGIVLYAYGRIDSTMVKQPEKDMSALATSAMLGGYEPTPTQKASYKFFAVAAVLFLLQVLAGVLAIHDFVGFFGWEVEPWLPVTITRSWHLMLALYWISACWIGATVFVLPMISRPEPRNQIAWVNALFWMLVLLVGGSAAGVVLGPHGLLGEWWHQLGHQGWEFVEMGKLWQWLLYVIFAVWGIIVARGVWPALKQKDAWSLPNWLLYTIVGIIMLFSSGFVATPDTNFVIADFWRWMVIHMWVEAFFELFTTIIVAYFMVLMGLVSGQVAQRVVYLGAVLFLGSGLLGISHNFYWNAKSTETIALGAIFSSLQVVPLILLSVEAWRFRQMPHAAIKKLTPKDGKRPVFGLAEAFLFLIGVNFWNFMGAGVFGFMINLPIVNYYEHGTYLTVNHGHAALMGVYGNLSIAAMVFCGRYLVQRERWNAALLQCSFWSMNLGLALMVVLDLFPAGVHQLMAVLDHGYWFSRSQEFILGDAFQTMTLMRVIGGSLFLVGGVAPLTWFMVSRAWELRDARKPAADPVVASTDVMTVLDYAPAPARLSGGSAPPPDLHNPIH